MKAKLTIAFIALMVCVLIFPNGIKADPMTVYFPTLGNCYLCKLRIEEAVNKLEGIDVVDWSYDTKITTVTYDDQVTDPYLIMHAIAGVGHDTEWYPAPDSAYNALIGTCCEYERTIDYSTVQVGYLSLMDLWIFHVGLTEPEPLAEMSVYPTAGTTTFNISLSYEGDISSFEISVFNMVGSKVHSVFVNNTQVKLDLGYLQRGQYVIVVMDNNKVIARSKLIKL